MKIIYVHPDRLVGGAQGSGAVKVHRVRGSHGVLPVALPDLQDTEMIMTPTPILRIKAWIYEGRWMWHLQRDGRVIRWSRGGDQDDFCYCAIQGHA